MSASVRAARTDLRQALQLLANRIPRVAENKSIANVLAGKVGDLRRRASSLRAWAAMPAAQLTRRTRGPPPPPPPTLPPACLPWPRRMPGS